MKENPAKDELQQMIKRYTDGTATPVEKEFIEQYYAYLDNEADVLDQYDAEQKNDLEAKMEAFIMQKIQTPDSPETKPLWQNRVFRLLSAASILLLLGVFFYKSHNFNSKNNHSVLTAPADILPGSDKAVLTLSDGSNIILDKTGSGHLASDGDMSIRTNGMGEIEYTKSAVELGKLDIGMNKIATPVGGQYRVILPDGSKVWLNAMSSISYPTFFKGAQRKVTITGECYFEIAKEARQPFVVEIDKKQKIVVTGTHFNVNAYQNEANIRTTLVEGEVEVSQIENGSGNYKEKFIKLRAGTQSFIGKDGHLQIKEVNAEEMVAWKNGLFHFQDADIATVMRQVERWYNVDVSYQNGTENREFSGKIQRNVNLSQILEIFRFAGINVKMEPAKRKDSNGQIVLIP